MLPTRIRVLSSFPVSTTGKVDHRALTAHLAEHQAQQPIQSPVRGRVRVIASGRGV